MGRTDSMIDPQEQPEYHDLTAEEADRYCEVSVKHRVRSWLAARIGPVGHVLDLACGPGIDGAHYTPDQYLGVDWSQALVDAARRRNPQHRFLQADARCVPLPDRLFRTTYIKTAIEHTRTVEDAVDMVREALRLASERTYLIWHMPPFAREGDAIIQRVTGHYGKIVYQNQLVSQPFHDAIAQAGARVLDFHKVDIHTIWEIAVKDAVL